MVLPMRVVVNSKSDPTMHLWYVSSASMRGWEALAPRFASLAWEYINCHKRQEPKSSLRVSLNVNGRGLKGRTFQQSNHTLSNGVGTAGACSVLRAANEESSWPGTTTQLSIDTAA